MLLKAEECATYGGVNWLVEESPMPHADKLAAIDMIPLFHIDIAFGASSIVGGDVYEIWDIDIDGRKPTEQFLSILYIFTFSNHGRYLLIIDQSDYK